MPSINVPVQPAPSSPLNLQIGVVYAPRQASPPFVGYTCVEVEPDVFEIWAYDADGFGAVVFRGDLAHAYYRLAAHLGMTT